MSRAWILSAVVAVVFLGSGCGSSSTVEGETCPTGTTLQVFPETITVAAGSAGFDVVGGLSNDCKVDVQFSLAGPGTINPHSGIPIHYTPPATVTATTTATITASAAGLTDTVVVTITP